MRTRIWNNLSNIKFKAYYCSRCSAFASRCGGVYSFLLSGIATTCVAFWTIWGQYPVIWANIIAVSQLLHIARPHMPFLGQEKDYLSTSYAYESLYLQYERLWYDYESENFDSKKIEEIFYKFRQTEIDIEKSHKAASYPDIDFIIKKAHRDTCSFLSLNFEMEEDHAPRQATITA